jgi:hypothetical protein
MEISLRYDRYLILGWSISQKYSFPFLKSLHALLGVGGLYEVGDDDFQIRVYSRSQLPSIVAYYNRFLPQTEKHLARFRRLEEILGYANSPEGYVPYLSLIKQYILENKILSGKIVLSTKE